MPAPAWMVIGADTSDELNIAKANGHTHGLVEVFWDQCQTTSGGAVTATAVNANIDRIIAAGMKVCLRVSLQYIPTFVDTAAVKFRRNGSVDFNPGNVSGNNARDWVWSATTRALVQDFLTKLFQQITWSKIDRVQLGGGPAGELQYPDSDGTQWWGYSAPAQTGTGLAAGQTVCPVPGHVPSTGTTWSANDISFHTWYRQSLINWMTWLVGQHRAFFSGPIWVMHPGAGLRPVSQTPTSADQALNFRVNAAKGLHWAEQIAAYPDADVHPYSTWADSPHFWPPDPYSDTNDGNAAPWYHLLRTARATGRATRIWGENTGGQTNIDVDRIFSDGAVAHGYQGLVWLSHDTLIAGGSAATYSNLSVRIGTANKAFGSGLYLRGVNMAGAEFSHDAAHLPGVYDTDYAYDTASGFSAMGTRGHKLVRLPFRWERIQPTRGAALNTAELTRLKAAVSNINAAGMIADLDLHNYGRYIRSAADGGAELVLGDTLPTADLVNLWTRLSTEFKSNSNVRYGLMNEPHDLPGSSGAFSGVTRYDWNNGTVQGWTGDSATASNVSSKLRLSATATSGFFLFRKDDAATLSGGTLTGNTLQAEITLGAGVAGAWSALLQWQTSAFQWQNPSSTTYTRVDNGQIVTGLIAGVAVNVRATWTSGINSPLAFAIQIESNAATAGAVSVDVDNFGQGTLTGSGGGAQTWEVISQQLVTAIRNNGDTNHIRVPGHGFSGAKNWTTEHPDPWISDPAGKFSYEFHYYFDVDNSGDYPDTYATENTAAIAAGYTNLSSRVAREVSGVLQWGVRYGVRLFCGETGWTRTESTSSWNAVGETLYDEFDRYNVDVAYWSAGRRWGTGYNLSVYTGEAQSTLQAQAGTIEAHPSTAAGASAVVPVVPVTPTAMPDPLSSGTLRNLFPNPALANNVTGWTSTAGGYVRSTGLTGLPRTTGWTGTAITDSNTPRAQVTAGQQYVYSVSIKAVADQSFNMLVNFYAAASGGAFIGNSGATVQVNLSAGQVQRFIMGPYTVPAGAVSSHLKFNDVDAGGVQITAIRCALYSGNVTSDGEYFDGSTTGAGWEGTAGDSTSSIRIFRDRGIAGDLFNLINTPLGPVATEQATATDDFTIQSTSVIYDEGFATDGFLIAELGYDNARGRVRLYAFTFAETVTQVKVQRRVFGGKYEDVRGGTVAVLEGLMVRPVDDYEYPAGVDVDYRIQGLSDTGEVVQQATVHRSAAEDVAWLKFVSNPYLNRKIHLTDWSEITRDSRADIYEVVGRSDPVVVTDVHGSRRATVQIITPTVAETKSLDEALSQGYPIFLQVPDDLQLPTMYAAVGNYSYERLSPKSVRSRWSIPLIEVSPPPFTLVGSLTTYATVLAQYPKYSDVLEGADRYRDLVA